MTRMGKKVRFVLTTLSLALSLQILLLFGQSLPSVEFIKTNSPIEVVDGDTAKGKFQIVFEGKVRYLGIDTPEEDEKECYFAQAEEENRKLLDQARLELEFDEDPIDSSHGDRLLAYVFATKQGERVFVNQELLKRGFAILQTIPPNDKYRVEFKRVAEEAFENGVNIWSAYPKGCFEEEWLKLTNLSNAEETLSNLVSRLIRVEFIISLSENNDGKVYIKAINENTDLLTGVIYADDVKDLGKQNLNELALDASAGKTACITGKLEWEQGVYQIIVEAPWQIQILEAGPCPD